MGNSTWARFTAAVIILVGALTTTAGCGGDKGTLKLSVSQTGAVGDPNKPLFSTWTEINNLYILDLRSATFGGGIAPANVTAITGQACACQVQIQGTEISGTISISSCTGVPQCSTYNGNGTYTRNGADLSFCSAVSGCATLR